ncbi:hypothetical protein D3C85_1790330 [compost metagenome]
MVAMHCLAHLALGQIDILAGDTIRHREAKAVLVAANTARQQIQLVGNADLALAIDQHLPGPLHRAQAALE